MRKLILAILVIVLVPAWTSAADKEAIAIIDKAIKATGGEKKLAAVKGMVWKTKGKMYFNGAGNEMEMTTTVGGLTKARQEFKGNFNGNEITGNTVVSGDKGFREFAGMKQDMNKDQLAQWRLSLYMDVLPITLVQLKGKEFKVEASGEEKVNGKAASVLKVTGPKGETFSLLFDKESGLPVKTIAEVQSFGGEKVKQEITMDGYKEFKGVKKATKILGYRGGEKFVEQEVTEFKVLDKVEDKTFK